MHRLGTHDGFGPEMVDADKSTAHARDSRTDQVEVRIGALWRTDRADASDHQGVVAKYVVRIERTGLGSDVLMSMADVEGMAGIAPASRPAS